MRPIEFYTTPEGEVTIREMGMPERQLKESDTDFIQRFWKFLKNSIQRLTKHCARPMPNMMGTGCGVIFLQYVDSLNVISVCMTMKLILMKIGTSSSNLWDAQCEVSVQDSKLYVSRSSTASYQTGSLK